MVPGNNNHLLNAHRSSRWEEVRIWKLGRKCKTCKATWRSVISCVVKTLLYRSFKILLALTIILIIIIILSIVMCMPSITMSYTSTLSTLFEVIYWTSMPEHQSICPQARHGFQEQFFFTTRQSQIFLPFLQAHQNFSLLFKFNSLPPNLQSCWSWRNDEKKG
jgi:hypothetical protein